MEEEDGKIISNDHRIFKQSHFPSLLVVKDEITFRAHQQIKADQQVIELD